MKSFNNIKKFSLFVLVIIMINGCTKKFNELNTDPKLLSEDLVTSEFLLTNVQVTAGAGLGASDAGNYAGMTVRVDNVPFDDRFDDDAWYTAYTSLGNNLAAIIRKTAGDPDSGRLVSAVAEGREVDGRNQETRSHQNHLRYADSGIELL